MEFEEMLAESVAKKLIENYVRELIQQAIHWTNPSKYLPK